MNKGNKNIKKWNSFLQVFPISSIFTFTETHLAPGRGWTLLHQSPCTEQVLSRSCCIRDGAAPRPSLPHNGRLCVTGSCALMRDATDGLRLSEEERFLPLRGRTNLQFGKETRETELRGIHKPNSSKRDSCVSNIPIKTRMTVFFHSAVT